MSSPAQVSANQANAQRSTGPRTPQGKAAVAQNAIRHGLTARHLVIRPDEQEEFTTLQNSLLAELDPQGAVETVTFHELVHAAWSLHRFRRIEAQISDGGPADFLDAQTIAILDRLTRYQARSQRAYYKSLHELRALQTNRPLRPVKLDEQAAVETPAIADISELTKQAELTKQTHSAVTAEAINQAIHIVQYETDALGLKTMQNSTRATQSA